MAVESLKVAVDDIGLSDDVADWIKVLLWKWVRRNGDKTVRLSFWFVHKTFRVRDLESVFALLLGPAPKV